MQNAAQLRAFQESSVKAQESSVKAHTTWLLAYTSIFFTFAGFCGAVIYQIIVYAQNVSELKLVNKDIVKDTLDLKKSVDNLAQVQQSWLPWPLRLLFESPGACPSLVHLPAF